MKRLLVIEDGDEYAEFARVFLARDFEVQAARSADEALATLAATGADALFVDLRFDRTVETALTGDPAEIATRLFAGNRARALRYLQDQQGTFILARLRAAGHGQPALFVHGFPARRLENLRQLYGDVRAVPSFDANAIRRALGVPE
jgi:ActR/RegA family two-component response regulator